MKKKKAPTPKAPTRRQIEDWLCECDYTLLLADGLDEAFLGVEYDRETVRAVYSRDKCIAVLARSMPLEDAQDYFDYNVAGAYVGPATPIFISTPFLK